MIPYNKQEISDKDINAVIKVLKSKFITQGPIVKKFEKIFLNMLNPNILFRLIVAQVLYMQQSKYLI